MQALTYHGAKDIRFEEFADATIQKPDQVVVKMQKCGICGSDLHIYHGEGFSKDLGFCVGHEAVGEVVEVGADVKRYQTGDQVMISAAVGCGACTECLTGHVNLCSNNGTACYGLSHKLQGCQAEGIVVPRADFNLAKIPQGVSLDQALMLTDNLPTAYLGCENADIKPGADVLVVGLGPIGLMAVEIAFVLGAGRVFALDLVKERRDMAQVLGAHPLQPDTAKDELAEQTQGKMVQSVVEAVGADATLKIALSLAGKQATVSTIGVNQNMQFSFPMALAMVKGLTFRTSLCSVQCHWPELIKLVQNGRLNPERFITHEMPLSEGREAYRLFDQKVAGALKMILTP